jgi:hypothetical protein
VSSSMLRVLNDGLLKIQTPVKFTLLTPLTDKIRADGENWPKVI